MDHQTTTNSSSASDAQSKRVAEPQNAAASTPPASTSIAAAAAAATTKVWSLDKSKVKKLGIKSSLLQALSKQLNKTPATTTTSTTSAAAAAAAATTSTDATQSTPPPATATSLQQRITQNFDMKFKQPAAPSASKEPTTPPAPIQTSVASAELQRVKGLLNRQILQRQLDNEAAAASAASASASTVQVQEATHPQTPSPLKSPKPEPEEQILLRTSTPSTPIEEPTLLGYPPLDAISAAESGDNTDNTDTAEPPPAPPPTRQPPPVPQPARRSVAQRPILVARRSRVAVPASDVEADDEISDAETQRRRRLLEAAAAAEADDASSRTQRVFPPISQSLRQRRARTSAIVGHLSQASAAAAAASATTTTDDDEETSQSTPTPTTPRRRAIAQRQRVAAASAAPAAAAQPVAEPSAAILSDNTVDYIVDSLETRCSALTTSVETSFVRTPPKPMKAESTVDQQIPAQPPPLPPVAPSTSVVTPVAVKLDKLLGADRALVMKLLKSKTKKAKKPPITTPEPPVPDLPTPPPLPKHTAAPKIEIIEDVLVNWPIITMPTPLTAPTADEVFIGPMTPMFASSLQQPPMQQPISYFVAEPTRINEHDGAEVDEFMEEQQQPQSPDEMQGNCESMEENRQFLGLPATGNWTAVQPHGDGPAHSDVVLYIDENSHECESEITLVQSQNAAVPEPQCPPDDEDVYPSLLEPTHSPSPEKSEPPMYCSESDEVPNEPFTPQIESMLEPTHTPEPPTYCSEYDEVPIEPFTPEVESMPQADDIQWNNTGLLTPEKRPPVQSNVHDLTPEMLAEFAEAPLSDRLKEVDEDPPALSEPTTPSTSADLGRRISPNDSLESSFHGFSPVSAAAADEEAKSSSEDDDEEDSDHDTKEGILIEEAQSTNVAAGSRAKPSLLSLLAQRIDRVDLEQSILSFQKSMYSNLSLDSDTGEENESDDRKVEDNDDDDVEDELNASDSTVWESIHNYSLAGSEEEKSAEDEDDVGCEESVEVAETAEESADEQGGLFENDRSESSGRIQNRHDTEQSQADEIDHTIDLAENQEIEATPSPSKSKNIELGTEIPESPPKSTNRVVDKSIDHSITASADDIPTKKHLPESNKTSNEQAPSNPNVVSEASQSTSNPIPKASAVEDFNPQSIAQQCFTVQQWPSTNNSLRSRRYAAMRTNTPTKEQTSPTVKPAKTVVIADSQVETQASTIALDLDTSTKTDHQADLVELATASADETSKNPTKSTRSQRSRNSKTPLNIEPIGEHQIVASAVEQQVPPTPEPIAHGDPTVDRDVPLTHKSIRTIRSRCARMSTTPVNIATKSNKPVHVEQSVTGEERVEQSAEEQRDIPSVLKVAAPEPIPQELAVDIDVPPTIKPDNPSSLEVAAPEPPIPQDLEIDLDVEPRIIPIRAIRSRCARMSTTPVQIAAKSIEPARVAQSTSGEEVIVTPDAEPVSIAVPELIPVVEDILTARSQPSAEVTKSSRSKRAKKSTTPVSRTTDTLPDDTVPQSATEVAVSTPVAPQILEDPQERAEATITAATAQLQTLGRSTKSTRAQRSRRSATPLDSGSMDTILPDVRRLSPVREQIKPELNERGDESLDNRCDENPTPNPQPSTSTVTSKKSAKSNHIKPEPNAPADESIDEPAIQASTSTTSTTKSKRGRKTKFPALPESRPASQAKRSRLAAVDEQQQKQLQDEEYITPDMPAASRQATRSKRNAKRRIIEDDDDDDDEDTDANQSMVQNDDDDYAEPAARPTPQKRNRKSIKDYFSPNSSAIGDDMDSTADALRLAGIGSDEEEAEVGVEQPKQPRHRTGSDRQFLMAHGMKSSEAASAKKSATAAVRAAVKRAAELGIEVPPEDVSSSTRKPRAPRKTTAGEKRAVKLGIRAGLSADVVCGNCRVTLARADWDKHYHSHYGQTWIEGEEEALVMEPLLKVGNRMQLYRAKNKLPAFICAKCGTQKKSGVGFLSHMQVCGLSVDEITSAYYSCPHCPALIRHVSISSHNAICPGLQAASRERDRIEREAAAAAEAEEEPIDGERQNNAGRVERRSAVKARRTFKGDDDGTGENTPQDFVIERPLAMNGRVVAAWEQQLATKGQIKCKNCPFTETTIEAMTVHHPKCPLAKNFACKAVQCPYRALTASKLAEHAALRHLNMAPPNERDFGSDSGSEADVGAESTDSEGSSGEPENEEDGEEHGDDASEIGGDGSQRSPSKKKEKKKKKKKGDKKVEVEKVEPNKKQETECSLPDRVFLGQHRPPSSAHQSRSFYPPAMKMTAAFHSHHYSPTPLYSDLFSVSISHLLANTTTSVLLSYYLPPRLQSPPFQLLPIRQYNCVVGTEPVAAWQLLPRFKAVSTPRAHILYCGAPIQYLDWIPLPADYPAADEQHLAIITKPGSDGPDGFKLYQRVGNEPQRCCLQLWSLRGLPSSSATPQAVREAAPRLRYTVLIDRGPVLCMAMLPSGGYDVARAQLAVVAVPAFDGDVRLIAMPRPQEVGAAATASESGALKLRSSLVLEACEGVGAVSRLDWSRTRGHRTVVAGYVTGAVMVWSLAALGDELWAAGEQEQEEAGGGEDREGDDGVRRLVCTHVLWPSVLMITQLNLHHDSDGSDRWLAVGSSDKKVRFFDLHHSAPDVEVSQTMQKSRITDGVWPLNWSTFLTVLDDSYWTHASGIMAIQPLMLGTKPSHLFSCAGSASAVAFSDWLNTYIYCSDYGEVRVAYCHQLLVNFADEHRRHRAVLGYTDVVPVAQVAEPAAGTEEVEDGATKLSVGEGIVFCDFKSPLFTTEAPMTAKYRMPTMEQVPTLRITAVRFNPNSSAFKLFALGYETGFVRVCHLRAQPH